MKYFLTLIISCLVLFACVGKKKDTSKKDDVIYTCSMDPQVRENKPGKCPICKMDLTPVRKADNKNMDQIVLSPQQVQLGNIRVDTLRNSAIGDQVILPATLSVNQLKTNSVSARIMGRIEKLYFKNVGDYISKGDKLFDLYSEELNNSKQEYLLVLEKQTVLGNAQIDFGQLARAAKNKLLLWGMNELQIQELTRSKKASPFTTFYSTATGFITSLEVKEGDYVQEGGTVVKLADLSSLWVEAQVYSSQLSAINRNAQVLIQFPDLPGKDLTGRVGFVNPEINADTRINLVRITIPNPGNRLRPGMQANMVLRNSQHNSLSLPSDAVIRDARGASVWVQQGVNKFKNKMVDIGIETNNRIEIRGGLQSGDVVVISGAYLLNSEYIFTVGSNPMAGMKM